MSWSLHAKFGEKRTLLSPQDTESSKGLRITPTDVESLIRHTQSLQDYATRPQNAQSDAVSESIDDAIAFFRRFTNDITKLVPASAWPTGLAGGTAVKAQEVFDTPELLDEILLYMSTKEKLSAMEVQRAWRDTVVESPRLKHALGLKVDDQAKFFRSPFLSVEAVGNDVNPWAYNRYQGIPNLPGGGSMAAYRDSGAHAYYPTYACAPKPNTLKVQITLSSLAIRQFGKRMIGSRIKAMQLFNLPITSLETQIPCTYRGGCQFVAKGKGRGSLPAPPIMFEDKHMTVGDFREKTLGLINTHRSCEHPPQNIEWLALLQLRKDDPIVSAAAPRLDIRNLIDKSEIRLDACDEDVRKRVGINIGKRFTARALRR